MTEAGTPRNVLVTAGRFMPTTGVVHALLAAGARVDVCDSIAVAPALHARGIAKAHGTPAPLPDPVAFAHAVAGIVRERDIDLVYAPFEDGFFLSRYRDLIPARLFVPDFATIEVLHNKATFVELCRGLGLPTPPTEIVTSQAAMAAAVGRFEEYFARPAYSRAGTQTMTNHGAHAGERTVDDCEVSKAMPWLVQAYVAGEDTCVTALARGGKVELLVAYEPALASTGGFSVRFRTIEDPFALELARTVCGHFGYTGLVGFDYRRTADGPVILECNPRTSAGCFLMDEKMLGRAILGGLDGLHVVPAGRSKQYDSYLMDRHTTEMSMREIVHALLSAPDALVSHLDVLPFVYSFVLRSNASREAYRRHVAVTDIAFGDTTWDGSPMPAPS